MKVNKSHSLIWFILLSVNFALGSPAISDITITPNQGAGTITISYSIEGITNTAEVTAQASIDGGSSYSVSLSNATGAVGTGITNGSGKTIVWQADQDLPNGGPFEMRIKLDAFEQSTGSSGSTNEEYPTQDFTVSSAYKLPKTGCTWDSPHLPYDDGELQIGREFSFTDNGDGTVTDNNTGLMWIQDFNIGRNNGDFFEDENATKLFVDNLEYAGYDDWRLPTKRELCFIMKVTDEPMLVFDPRYFKNVNYLPIFYETSYSYRNFQRTYSTYNSGWAVTDIFQWDKLSVFGNLGLDTWPSSFNMSALTSMKTAIGDDRVFKSEISAYSYHKKFFNTLIVRGDDRTKPVIENVDNSTYRDLNNGLIYKLVNLKDSTDTYQEYIKDELTSKDYFINPKDNFHYINYLLNDELRIEGYRVANLNESLNAVSYLDINSSMTSTLSGEFAGWFNACETPNRKTQDICRRGFYGISPVNDEYSYKDNDDVWKKATYSNYVVHAGYQSYPNYIILVKSL